MTATHFASGSAVGQPAITDGNAKPDPSEIAAEVRLHVRVVDSAGKAISNAAVRVLVLASHDGETRAVEFGDSPRLDDD